MLREDQAARAPHTFSAGKKILLLSVVALVLFSSIGLITIVAANKAAEDNTSGTATAAAYATSLAFSRWSKATTQTSITSNAQARITVSVQQKLFPATPASSNRSVVSSSVSMPNPYPPYQGILVLNDPLSNNKLGHAWDVNGPDRNNDKNICRFAHGVYESLSDSLPFPEGQNSCLAENTNFSNFAFEMQVNLLHEVVTSGVYTCAGISFRARNSRGDEYTFNICPHVENEGHFAIQLYLNHSFQKLLVSGNTPAIRRGLNRWNLLAVVARGSRMDFYINYQKVASIIDHTLSSGQIGCTAWHFYTSNEVECSDAKVWSF